MDQIVSNSQAGRLGQMGAREVGWPIYWAAYVSSAIHLLQVTIEIATEGVPLFWGPVQNPIPIPVVAIVVAGSAIIAANSASRSSVGLNRQCCIRGARQAGCFHRGRQEADRG